MNVATNARFSPRSCAGVCVVLLLVSSLLLVPTACECGAGVAHGHSLFVMPGHHHGPENLSLNDGQYHSGNAHDYQIEAPAQSGSHPAGQVAHGVDRLLSVLVNALTLLDRWQRFSYPGTIDSLGDGRIDTPDAPPPRQRGQGRNIRVSHAI